MRDLQNMLDETLEFYRQQERAIVAALASLPRGRIKEKKIRNKIYYYLQYRDKEKVKDKYLGKDFPAELAEKIEKRKKLEQQLRNIKKAIKMISKKESEVELIEPIRELFHAFTKYGLWEVGIEVVGTWCFYLYQKYLFDTSYPIATMDIDILIPWPYKGRAFDISRYLKELGFSEHFNPDGLTYFTGFGIKIEFLAPERGKGMKKPEHIKSLGVTPQLLRYMDILLKESVELKISRGIKARVPAPSAFLIHKLLVAQKRREPGKKEKDIKQAIYAARYILQNPEEREKLLSLWNSLPNSWKNRVKRQLQMGYELLPLEIETIEALSDLLP